MVDLEHGSHLEGFLSGVGPGTSWFFEVLLERLNETYDELLAVEA